MRPYVQVMFTIVHWLYYGNNRFNVLTRVRTWFHNMCIQTVHDTLVLGGNKVFSPRENTCIVPLYARQSPSILIVKRLV